MSSSRHYNSQSSHEPAHQSRNRDKAIDTQEFLKKEILSQGSGSIDSGSTGFDTYFSQVSTKANQQRAATRTASVAAVAAATTTTQVGYSSSSASNSGY